MDECLSWSAPSSQRPVRNNSTVAGSPLLHDSAHPDYRDPLVHKQLEKKLTTCNWYITSRNGMPNAETVILPEREVQMSPHTSTAQDNSAIERSWPKSIFHTHHTSRTRETNPLQPIYRVPTKRPDSVPMGCHSTVPEGHVFHTMRHPEWSFNRGSYPLGSQNRDIDGSYAKRREAQRPNKDMDLDSITKPRCKPVSTRQPREIDVGRLGMWSRCPDRHMQNSKRHCDPLHPTYCIHEHELKPVAPRKVTRLLAGHRLSERMQGEVGPDKQTLANQMHAMARKAAPRNFFPRKYGVLDLHDPAH